MISTTAIPSYSDYDPRWRMDDPFESLKVDDNGEERNGLPILSVSAMREKIQVEDEEKRTTTTTEEEEDSNVLTINMSNEVVLGLQKELDVIAMIETDVNAMIEAEQIVNEGMKEDDLQSTLAPNLSPAPVLNFVDGAILATASILETFGVALNVLFPKHPAKFIPEPSPASSEWYNTENNLVGGTLLATAALFNADVGDITFARENVVDGTTLAKVALFDAVADDKMEDSYSLININPEVN